MSGVTNFITPKEISSKEMEKIDTQQNENIAVIIPKEFTDETGTIF